MEILLYRSPFRVQTVEVRSDEEGIFHQGGRYVSHDKPYILLNGQGLEIANVKVADETTKTRLQELQNKIVDLQKEKQQLLNTAWSELPSVAWDWMREHEPLERRDHVEEPYQKAKAIKSLRKGSKVLVDGSQEAIRYGAALKIGRLRRRGPQTALLQFKTGLRYVPYYILLPYSKENLKKQREELKKSLPLVALSRKISRTLSDL